MNMKKVFRLLICLGLVLSFMTNSVFAMEGEPESFWGKFETPNHTGRHFAFADSRYYDGTDKVNVFNIGIDLGYNWNGAAGFYTNGDWSDLTKVYRREDYYKNQEFTDFSDNGEVAAPKPEGYSINDVGADADGTLSSYNAGVYTKVSLFNFDTFGRSAKRNYEGIVPDGYPMTTYIEIWKVDPELELAVDHNSVKRGDTFTATLTINNHFNNVEGLPAAEQVTFVPENATAISEVTKMDNTYQQKFQATEDINVDSIRIKGSVLDTAMNYNAAEKELTLPLDKLYSVSYEFISDSNDKEFPNEIIQLLPHDEQRYESGTAITAMNPEHTSVKVKDGVWEFKGYDADSKTIDSDITFVGTWTFTSNATGENKTESAEPGNQNGSGTINKPGKTETKSVESPKTGDNSQLTLWIALISIGILGLTGTILYQKRKLKDSSK